MDDKKPYLIQHPEIIGEVEAPPEMAPKEEKLICLHCEKCKADRPRGLCSRCYREASIRCLYPPVINCSQMVKDVPPLLPVRKEGEPYYRCTWCVRYRCKQPLKLCGKCQEECERMLKTIPKGML